MTAPEQFEIAIPQADLDDLLDRLARTRWVDDFANDDWRYGVPSAYLRELVDHWLNVYDWRAHEAAMNEFQHYRVVLDDVPVHYLFVPGRGRRNVPLILTHGWPWTFWDYAKVLRPLSDPASVGASDDLAFDLVVPSLPGHVFSSPLRQPNRDPDTAGLWTRLMTEVLGYERFGAYGGDRGGLVTALLAHLYPERLIGALTSLPVLPGFDFRNLRPEDFAPEEEGWWETFVTRSASTRVHVAVNTDEPQTVAHALTDSPAGAAAWITQRRHWWSDWEHDHEEAFTKDDLITTTSLYWLTKTFHTAARLYADNGLSSAWRPSHDRTPTYEAPFGVVVFPRDIIQMPKKVFAERTNLVHWSVQSKGGHFAPHEQPELVTNEVRLFFGTLV